MVGTLKSDYTTLTSLYVGRFRGQHGAVHFLCSGVVSHLYRDLLRLPGFWVLREAAPVLQPVLMEVREHTDRHIPFELSRIGL